MTFVNNVLVSMTVVNNVLISMTVVKMDSYQ